MNDLTIKISNFFITCYLMNERAKSKAFEGKKNPTARVGQLLTNLLLKIIKHLTYGKVLLLDTSTIGFGL